MSKIAQVLKITLLSWLLVGCVSLKNVDENPEVTGIRLGYFLPMSKGEASIYAIPAYEIEICNKKIYYYDARENISSDVILLGSRNTVK